MASNSSFLSTYNLLYIISGWGVVAYNIYFTVQFVTTLYVVSKARGRLSEHDRQVSIIAIKGIIHCISSSGANLFGSYSLTYGCLLYLVWIPVGIHVLFNCKIEKILLKATKPALRIYNIRPQKSFHPESESPAQCIKLKGTHQIFHHNNKVHKQKTAIE